MHSTRCWFLVQCFVLGVLSLCFQGVACAGLFLNTDEVGELVDSLSDDELATFTSGLGMPGLSKDEIKVSVCQPHVGMIMAVLTNQRVMVFAMTRHNLPTTCAPLACV